MKVSFRLNLRYYHEIWLEGERKAKKISEVQSDSARYAINSTMSLCGNLKEKRYLCTFNKCVFYIAYFLSYMFNRLCG